MNRFTPPTKVEVRRSETNYLGRNRCVFAAAPIAAGEEIEVCPVIRMPRREVYEEPVHLPTISHYLFSFGEEAPWGELVALALGFGSIYNHSKSPNADFKIGKDHISFYALAEIAAGEEVTIDYFKDQAVTEFKPARLPQ